jgi:esterase/lipase superfamily enzyme
VLAAPDINAKKFTNQLSNQLASSSRNVTLYASSGDKALRLSKEVHGYRRAGESGDGLLVLDGIETVDASKVDTDWLGHTYFAEQTSLLSDLFMIVKHGHKADARQLSRGVKDGKTYWLFPNTN